MKKIIAVLFAIVLCFCCTISVFAADDEKPYLIDNADLFTAAQEEELSKSLEKASKKYGADVVVLSIISLEGEDIVSYADDYYDYNGYSENGVLLLISLDKSDSAGYVSTSGFCIDAFDEVVFSDIKEEVGDRLRNGEYYNATKAFVKISDKAIDAEVSFPFFKNLLIALVIGFVIALIAVSVMRSQLKSVRTQAGADTYLKPGSLNITRANELFLYRNVVRTAIPKNNSSGGGGGVHTSSSGRSHGGGRI